MNTTTTLSLPVKYVDLVSVSEEAFRAAYTDSALRKDLGMEYEDFFRFFGKPATVPVKLEALCKVIFTTAGIEILKNLTVDAPVVVGKQTVRIVRYKIADKSIHIYSFYDRAIMNEIPLVLMKYMTETYHLDLLTAVPFYYMIPMIALSQFVPDHTAKNQKTE